MLGLSKYAKKALKSGKKVWVQNGPWDGTPELLKIEQVIKPNKFDCYLVVSSKRSDNIYDDGKTIPIDMILLDVNNDEFYPDTKEVGNIMNKIDKTITEKCDLESKLDNIWLYTWFEDD